MKAIYLNVLQGELPKIVDIISNLEEYGKLMAFCIQNDISAWRTYWDERDTDTCYSID